MTAHDSESIAASLAKPARFAAVGIGQPALAVALNDTLYGERSELLFDPKTSRLLGERSVVVKPPPAYHVKPGTVESGDTYITSGIVERIGQVPGG